MNLSDNHLRVLSALRGATMLEREPGTLTPDGHVRWFTLPELDAEDRFGGPGTDLAALSGAARSLYKRHLVAQRTTFTVTRYAITTEGSLALAGWEAAHGVAALAAAALDLDQAEQDERKATAALRDARGRRGEAARRLAAETARHREGSRR